MFWPCKPEKTIEKQKEAQNNQMIFHTGWKHFSCFYLWVTGTTRNSSWLLAVILKEPNIYNNAKCYGSDIQIWHLSLLCLGTLHWNASVSEKGAKCWFISYNRTADFHTENKDLSSSKPGTLIRKLWSEMTWLGGSAARHSSACSPLGLGSKLWDGKGCKHKVLFKTQTSSKKTQVLTTRKISFKMFRQNCSREL